MRDAARWSAAKPILVGIASLAALLFGFGAWATLSSISGAVIASGRIEVDQNRQIVQHPDGGVVAEILVEEGDTVRAGDVLLRLDIMQLASRLTIVESQLFELMARRARLEAERDARALPIFDPLLSEVAARDMHVRDLMDGQIRLLAARAETMANRVAQLDKRRDQMRDQIAGVQAQQRALIEQITLIERELADQERLLEMGLAQAARSLALRRERARLNGILGDLSAQKAQAEGRLTEIDIEQGQIVSARREEAITTLRDLQFRELELRERRLALTEQLSRLNIRAPVSGVIYGLTVFAPQSVLRPADPVLYIVPQDRPLIINAKVDPIHIDAIFVGQDVTLRLAGLDQRSTPELTGQVVHISADAFDDERRAITYYRAKISLSEAQRARLPKSTTLIPGMPVDAFMRTEDRTPISYLIQPLSNYFVRAFRE
ncbi:HlyD family type I secretion periplasmic adaptor subunit [Roseovarius sp. LXJ103]|uniref:HlyD family type I secretion periplasmic adaptor subunit n=1 Tax=Roseovarius carneus TaxID=2853164 RepID=UPI000D622032|nr:HlyD family type I secretion periplasmic adaptor subunit [Roseovarius carneus]MBZ8118661.1 HlyD family type I secretion periplasmic adaptor subunit [Roseovarius carneus]PWE35656.1 HlyD family type I secretion periplasmic adaptor subunit [Pelagicola sp. LXJ1103]